MKMPKIKISFEDTSDALNQLPKKPNELACVPEKASLSLFKKAGNAVCKTARFFNNPTVAIATGAALFSVPLVLTGHPYWAVPFAFAGAGAGLCLQTHFDKTLHRSARTDKEFASFMIGVAGFVLSLVPTGLVYTESDEAKAKAEIDFQRNKAAYLQSFPFSEASQPSSKKPTITVTLPDGKAFAAEIYTAENKENYGVKTCEITIGDKGQRRSGNNKIILRGPCSFPSNDP